MGLWATIKGWLNIGGVKVLLWKYTEPLSKSKGGSGMPCGLPHIAPGQLGPREPALDQFPERQVFTGVPERSPEEIRGHLLPIPLLATMKPGDHLARPVSASALRPGGD